MLGANARIEGEIFRIVDVKTGVLLWMQFIKKMCGGH